MDSGIASSVFTFIGVGLIILVIAALGFYTWYCLDRDIKLYEEIKASEENTGGQDGADGMAGSNGKSAFEIYNETHSPQLTLQQYYDLFNGQDGMPGEDALPAVNGSHGSDGSVGAQGEDGLEGIQGEPGLAGLQGIPGDSFFTYHLSDPTDVLNPALSAVLKSYEIIQNFSSSSSAEITYFYKGAFLTSMNFSWTTLSGSPPAYLSVIIYQDGKIIGLTEPITLYSFDRTQNINLNFTSGLEYRMIIAYSQARVRATPTINIFEQSLNSKAYTFQQLSNIDSYVQPFYDIVQNDAGFHPNLTAEMEKIYLSEVGSNWTTLNLSTFPPPP